MGLGGAKEELGPPNNPPRNDEGPLRLTSMPPPMREPYSLRSPKPPWSRSRRMSITISQACYKVERFFGVKTCFFGGGRTLFWGRGHYFWVHLTWTL